MPFDLLMRCFPFSLILYLVSRAAACLIIQVIMLWDTPTASFILSSDATLTACTMLYTVSSPRNDFRAVLGLSELTGISDKVRLAGAATSVCLCFDSANGVAQPGDRRRAELRPAAEAEFRHCGRWCKEDLRRSA